MFYFRKMILLGLAAAILSGGCQQPQVKKNQAKAKWDKASVNVRMPIAQQQFAQGHYQEAYKTVNEVLASDKNNADAHLLAGKLLMVQGVTPKGIEEVNEAVTLNAKLGEGHFLLGAVAEEKNDLTKAIVHYNNAISCQPDNVQYVGAAVRIYVALDQYENAQAQLKKNMAASPTDWEFKAMYAQLLQHQQKLDEAIDCYRQAVLLAPDNSELAQSLGYCYVLSGKWEQAAGVFETVANSCTDEQRKKELVEMLAACNLNAGQYGKAVSGYSKVTVNDRQSAQGWLKMGQAALATGSTEKAYACAERALMIESGYPEALVLEGCAQYMNKSYSAAIRTFDQVVTDRKQRAFSLLMIGKCYEKQGDQPRSRLAFNNARSAADTDLNEYIAKLIK